jgi:hypothetical protein
MLLGNSLLLASLSGAALVDIRAGGAAFCGYLHARQCERERRLCGQEVSLGDKVGR